MAMSIDPAQNGSRSSSGKLAGKVALVTGASKGIGKALAQGLAAAGARIAVNFKTDPEGAEATCNSIRELGGEAVPFQSDVSSKVEMERLVKGVSDKFGRFDILVNNAARTRFQSLFAVTEEDYDDVFDTNVRGPFFGSIAAAREMLRQDGGAIINISSCVTALTIPFHGIYTVSKTALEGMTRQMARELAPRIRVNAIAPSPTSTKRNQEYDPDYDSRWGESIPAGRIAFVEDYIGTCVYLASEDSTFLTGQVLRVDGGWSLVAKTPDLGTADFSSDFDRDAKTPSQA
jgi:3-oxoacyl-[acyl-carrier protein] reductase